MSILFCYLILINAAAVLIMLADKKNAIQKRSRVPERTLMFLAFCGGSIGIFAGMWFFRHKTRKPKFLIGVPVAMIFDLGIFLLIKGRFLL